uniref:Condensin-2 complex subunit H2 n=1 Tax=Pseudonaja textilis TaxID=8673 RepID=A0A670ZEC9_PSETE
MEDVESRFMHFLQPIRDLTKNWEVDVAAQLGEYLEEQEGGWGRGLEGALGGWAGGGEVCRGGSG